jgi:hypothetical protein
MDRLLSSLDDAPIIDKDGYEYLVHPISNGVPMLDPALLREVAVEVIRVADLDVDAIGAEIADIVVVMRKVGDSALDDTEFEATSLVDITVENGTVTVH